MYLRSSEAVFVKSGGPALVASGTVPILSPWTSRGLHFWVPNTYDGVAHPVYESTPGDDTLMVIPAPSIVCGRLAYRCGCLENAVHIMSMESFSFFLLLLQCTIAWKRNPCAQRLDNWLSHMYSCVCCENVLMSRLHVITRKASCSSVRLALEVGEMTIVSPNPLPSLLEI